MQLIPFLDTKGTKSYGLNLTKAEDKMIYQAEVNLIREENRTEELLRKCHNGSAIARAQLRLHSINGYWAQQHYFVILSNKVGTEKWVM